MKVIELFRQLSYGELSNLSISDSGSGSIIKDKQPQLIHYINDGLLALFTKFILSEKSLLVEQAAHITNYHMRRRFTETSGSDVDWPYIKDLPNEPFEEDLIKILEVYRADGFKFPLNDTANPYSLFTPQPNILQVPYPAAGDELAVIYQAHHPKLDDRIDGPNNLVDQLIDIPVYLENALQLFVAGKVFSHMNGPENIMKGQEYQAGYEADCSLVDENDLANQTTSTSHQKLEQRGFV